MKPTLITIILLAGCFNIVPSTTIAQNTSIEYISRGLAKQAKGELDGAMADYNRALELNPKYALAYANRGYVKQVKGDLDGAIADFNRALELNPKDAVTDYSVVREVDSNDRLPFHLLQNDSRYIFTRSKDTNIWTLTIRDPHLLSQ